MAARDPQYAHSHRNCGSHPRHPAPPRPEKLTTPTLGEQIQPEAPGGHHADAGAHPQG